MIQVGEKYTGTQLTKEGVLPKWHKHAKSRCKWEVLEHEQFVRRIHGGRTAFANRIILRGKPRTNTGKVRKHPIKLNWVYE